MIGFIIFGLFVGMVARLLRPGRQRIGLIWTLLIGVAGSVIGGTIANLLDTGDIMELNVIGAISAIVASIVLLGVAEGAGLGSGRDPKRLGRS